MMLGEIALHKNEFERAKTQLETALTHCFAEEATFNLAMAHFKLEEYHQAAQMFASCDGDSSRIQLYEVVAWMYAGHQAKAKELLDYWNEDAYDYTGAIEIADVYAEMKYYLRHVSSLKNNGAAISITRTLSVDLPIRCCNLGTSTLANQSFSKLYLK